MSNFIYPDISEHKFEDKLYSLMEYNFLYTKYPYFSYRKPFKQQQLQYKKHQIFVHHFMNPNTPYNRLLLLHATGTGKTLSAYNVSRGFTEQWRQIEPSKRTYSIFIIAFTKDNIRNELIRYPALGFVSEQDLDLLENIRQIRGVESIEYRNQKNALLSRLCDPEYGGFFKFFGYQELTNRIFKYKKTGLEKESLTYDKLLDEISIGNIHVDEDFVKLFNYGLLICDEVHNVYNTDRINNYGSTILYLLFHTVGLKTLYLSATPLNNNPREIIDLMNILASNPSEILPSSAYKKLSENITELEKTVKSKLRGKISLYEDINPVEYPKRSIVGEKISGISIISFIRCYMSKHYYDNYIRRVNVTSSPFGVSLDNTLFMYQDIILPEAIIEERELDTKNQKWKEKYQLFVKGDIFYGDFFYKNNLRNYSPKYYQMVQELKKTEGKVFIYHKFKRKSGTNMIETILRNNGYIFFNEQPSSGTICAVCSRMLSEHKNIGHDFKPSKFITITGDLDANQRTEYRNYFNNVNNINGHDIKIIVGSPVMEEGSELFSVNDVFIMTLPVNISKFIQVVGRCVRKNSHIGLPENRQYVNIRVFIHSMTQDQTEHFRKYYNIPSKEKIFSLEEYLYKNKVEDHQEIQIIERFMKEIAIDLPLYTHISFDDELVSKAIRSSKITVSRYPNIDFDTFYFYGFVNDIIGFIIFFCKELFIRYKILSIEQIIQYFEKNDFQIEFNTKLVNSHLIKYVLNKMIIHSNVSNTLTKSEIYTIPGKKIRRIKDHYILSGEKENILSDILTKEQRNTEISILPYIQDIKTVIMKDFVELERTIKTDIDFLKIFEKNIPVNYIIEDIINSSNPVIKRNVKTFLELRKNDYKLLGIIDESGNFKLKETSNVSGVVCTSIKKNTIKKYLTFFPKYKAESKHKTKEICNTLKKILFMNHISQNNTNYLIINHILKYKKK